MDIEYHYYLTGIIARHAGFTKDEAKIIAYSSQYVDDNDVVYKVKDRDGSIFKNRISQTKDITKPQANLMHMYTIFHFIPGEFNANSAVRTDGSMNVVNTTPDSKNANKIFKKALESKNLFRIGIAAHGYVDTWAHQNFIGAKFPFNSMEILVPNIGHADALHYPDLVGCVWRDSRMINPIVNNNLRFILASKRLFEHFCEYLENIGRYNKSQRPVWNVLQDKLALLMGPIEIKPHLNKNKRIRGYINEAPFLDKYSEKKWFNDAIKTKVNGIKDSHKGILNMFNFIKDDYFFREYKEDSNWYKFQMAINNHIKDSFKILDPTFKKINLYIYRKTFWDKIRELFLK